MRYGCRALHARRSGKINYYSWEGGILGFVFIFAQLTRASLKRYLSFLLAWIILLNSFNQGIILMGYTLNKDYIARVLCVNRDKPQLGCQGKCHLKKQLKKAQETEQKTHTSLSKLECNWIALPFEIFRFGCTAPIECPSSFYQTHYTFKYLAGIYRPPAALLGLGASLAS